MVAVLRPIVAEILQRPTYDNQFLGYEADWVRMNEPLLKLWWDQCAEIGGTPCEESDFALFCRAQHDMQVEIRDELKRTLRQY